MNCPHCETEIDEHEANRCLDAWVAEAVMGWERSRHLGNWIFEGMDDARYVMQQHLPLFSTSIAAAWEVVGRMPGMVRIEGPYNDGWEVGSVDDMYEWEFLSRASAPLAICRAALKAV